MAVIGLSSACATQKEAAREREREQPATEFSEPKDFFEKPNDEPVALPSPKNISTNTGKSKEKSAGKSKGGKRQKTKDDADDELDYGDDDDDERESSNIFFQYASWELSPAAKRELSKAAATLKRNKSARVTLSGHTCDRSSPSVNIRLSQRRAEAASGYLQQAGISAKRISIEAYGQSQPLAPNTSEQNRAKNRRVEIAIEE